MPPGGDEPVEPALDRGLERGVGQRCAVDEPCPGRRSTPGGDQAPETGRADAGQCRQGREPGLVGQVGEVAPRCAAHHEPRSVTSGSERSWSATPTCSAVRGGSWWAKSAMVRARRRTRARPRAVRRPVRSDVSSRLVAPARERGDLLELTARQRGVAGHAPPRGPPAGRPHAGRHDLGGLAGAPAQQLVGVGPGNVETEVEAVEQGARQAPSVAGALPVAAAAGAGPVGLAAGARVHGGDEQDVRRQDHRGCGAGEADAPFFERLAQRVEHVGRELAELVEEQHAAARRRRSRRVAGWGRRRR